jgi:hypothetical protein
MPLAGELESRQAGPKKTTKGHEQPFATLLLNGVKIPQQLTYVQGDQRSVEPRRSRKRAINYWMPPEHPFEQGVRARACGGYREAGRRNTRGDLLAFQGQKLDLFNAR